MRLAAPPGRVRLAASALAALLAPAGPALGGEGGHHEPAPGPPPLFEPAAPGTYALPPIQRVSPHWLLASDGGRAALPDLAPGEAAVVSFLYSRCGDACPLALSALHRLDRALAERPGLAGRVRLASVSFDPGYDTPERMAALRRHMRPRTRWRFLTAPDPEALAPVLADYGQDAVPIPDDAGEIAALRHVLKVFLVDHRGDVRNIYSADFLDPRVLLADLLTVLGSDAGP